MTIEEFLKKLKHVANSHEHYRYLDDQIGGASLVTNDLKAVIEEWEASKNNSMVTSNKKLLEWENDYRNTK
tara:strand:- start:1313 stop:1525 length:213 start_codon:yes stop_codon:yes gene_type:complete